MYEDKCEFHMTKALISEIFDLMISFSPSKLGSISDAVVHQRYINSEKLPIYLL